MRWRDPAATSTPRIVHAARARFLRDGVDGASLRSIARDAGTSIGMVYYYFPTKDDLFLAVVEEVYAALLADSRRAGAADVPVRGAAARGSTRASGACREDELVVMRLVVREALVVVDAARRASSSAFSRGHVPLVLATVAAGRADGDLDAAQSPLLQLAAIVGMASCRRSWRASSRRGWARWP